jgi:hypothetical protein
MKLFTATLAFVLTATFVTSALALPGFGNSTLNTPVVNWSRVDYLTVNTTGHLQNPGGEVWLEYFTVGANPTWTVAADYTGMAKGNFNKTFSPPTSGFWPHVGNAVGTTTPYRVHLFEATGSLTDHDGTITRTQ